MSAAGNFLSHSFHIGAATVMARNGIPDHLIQALGPRVPCSPVCSPSSLQAPWRGEEFPLAGSRSQGHQGNLPAVPHTCLGPPPTFLGTSSQVHLLVTTLTK